MNDKQRKAKAYLSSYLVLVSQAERAYEDYERAYSRACRMTAGFGAPCGNGGTADIAENVPDLDVMDSEALLAFVRERQIGLVVIGPEAPRLYTARSDVIAAVAERNQLWGEVLEMVHVEGMRICDVRRFIEHDRRHAISEGAVYKLYYRALEKAFDEMERLGAKPSDGTPPQP